MTFFKTLTVCALLLFFTSAFAIDLDGARSSGKVKELPSGYLEASDNSAAVKKLVEEVNKKRKKHYEKVAKKNGTTVDVVGAKAAEKIQEKLNE